MLTLNLQQMIAALSKVQRNVLIAAAVVLLALVYSGSLGLQWWGDLGQADQLQAQIQQLQTALNSGAQDGAATSASLEERLQELGETLERFSFTTDDDIIGLVDAISRDARVTVASAGTKDAGTRVIGSQVYRVRTANFRVEGQVTRLLDFIGLLSDAVPSTGVPSSRMGGFGLAPWLILDVEFLLDPQPIEPTESGS
jgi:hypothetical protein